MQFAFIIFIAIAWGILFLVHWVVYATLARTFSFSLLYWPYFLALFSGSYLFASYLVRTVTNMFADWFYFIAASWLGFIFLLFSLVVVYNIIFFVFKFDSQYLLTIVIIVSIFLSIYALIQGHKIVNREYTIALEGLTQSVRVVHLSDIHIGTVHQTEYLERVVKITNDYSPDIVFVTGDLFDGSAPIEHKILLPLDQFKAKSFFSNGNHEEYEGLEKVRKTISHFDMQLLENEAIEYKGLQIIGVNDKQSLKNGQTLDSILQNIPESNLPKILLFHTPSDWNVAQSHDIDLMLSGHTHNGQLYPFTLLVKLSFKYINGLYKNDEKFLHVSPGTGTWGPPMRLGSRNQVTLLELIPKI